MLRPALLFSVAVCALLSGALPCGQVERAHAGGWSLKKARKSMQRRIKEATCFEKHADKIAHAGRRLRKSKVVGKAKDAVEDAVEDAGNAVGACVVKQAKAVEKAVCSVPKRLSWGFRGAKKRVVAEVQKAPPAASAVADPCAQPDPC